MIERIGKWIPVLLLVLLSGIITDVFFIKSFNFGWLWLLLTVSGGLLHVKYLKIKSKTDAKKLKKWENERDDLAKTFSDLETSYHSLRVPPTVCEKLDSYHNDNDNGNSIS